MLEKDIENLIAKYPDEFFPQSGFKLIGQQVRVGRCFVDIIFSDKYDRTILIEVKRGILSREGVGQVLDYYGMLKGEKPQDIIELILCANTIPDERREFLEKYDIECKELGVSKITEVAKRYAYRFLDDKELEVPGSLISKRGAVIEIEKQPIDDDINVWIFQANPARYDLLNAFSDPLLGDLIHWEVHRYRNMIKKGHTGLIWLSGKEAGIYGVTKILCDPAMMLEATAEGKYWLEIDDRNLQRLRVKMKITAKLSNRSIFRKELLQNNKLKTLSILRYSQATDFPVTQSEW